MEKRDFLKLFGTVSFAAAAGGLAGDMRSASHDGSELSASHNVYDRVIKTGVLRCGYTPWPGLLDVDPNTKKLSGVFVDYMQELANSMQLKVEWVAEVPFGEIPAALDSNRFDVHASGAWTNPVRGKFVDNVLPVGYQYISAFVRADDHRFDNDADKINSPKVRLTTIDGESSSMIAATLFSSAKTLSNPQGTDASQMLLDVISGKADVAFTDKGMLSRVIAKNPGKIREVKMPYPLQVYGNVIWVKKGEAKLKNMLDIATAQLINNGMMDRILSKHESVHGMFLRPSPSYQAPSAHI
jgi:ABC-type amino acid transport substrate-binding protein